MKKYLFIPTLLLTLSITIGCNNRQDKVANIDIPRSHSGMTLGAPYDSVKKVLKEHGFNIKKGPHSVGDLSRKPDIHEVIDEAYPSIKHLEMEDPFDCLSDDRYKKVSQEIRDKYFTITNLVFYNDTLVYMCFTPNELSEVVGRLKNKYPFEEKTVCDSDYPKITYTEYSCENDQTKMIVGAHPLGVKGYIIYYDKKLYAELERYIRDVDAKISNAHEREIDRIVSGF